MKTYFLLFLFLLFGCKQGSETTAIEVVNDFDISKSKELIRQVLANEQKDYFNTNCIVGEAIPMYVSVNSNIIKDVAEKLGIKDTVHLNEQIKLYNQFQLTSDIVSDKAILTKQDFQEFEKIEKKRLVGKSFWDLIGATCEDGYSYIFKPIFNEDYTRAYVQFGNHCGGYCGGGETQIYEYKNGKWNKVRTVSAWVS